MLPELKGKLDGTAIRIPTPNVSLVVLDFVPEETARPRTQINAAMKAAAEGRAEGHPRLQHRAAGQHRLQPQPGVARTFDATQTQVVDGGLVRVMSWYDNEWGFSNRMSDTAALFGKL